MHNVAISEFTKDICKPQKTGNKQFQIYITIWNSTTMIFSNVKKGNEG